MIQLNPDYLIFKTAAGENIPCSAELVAIELIGDAITQLDPELIRNASAAVLYYFKNELGKNSVSVGEFSLALERVLRGFGLNVKSNLDGEEEPVRVAESDLRDIAFSADKGFELFFFPNLRDEMRRKLDERPQVVRFNGLRSCVKHIVGAQRWSQRCQTLSDQIVEYLRTCLNTETNKETCALVVR
jgi:hypothetical protein